MNDALKIVAGILGIILIGIGAFFGITQFKKLTADYRGSAAATEQIHANGNYRIAKYNDFFDRCAAIQAKEATIVALREELTTAGPERKAIIESSLTGLIAGRATDIARYNAEAAKTDTAANFLASNLPHYIDQTKDRTSCATQ